MQTEINLSNSDIYVKNCVVDPSKACFLIMSKDAVIRLIVSSNQLSHILSVFRSTIPNECVEIDNNPIKNPVVRFETSIRVVDVRVGTNRFNGNLSLRFYTGKKHKHSITIMLTWGQLNQMYNTFMLAMEGVSAV